MSVDFYSKCFILATTVIAQIMLGGCRSTPEPVNMESAYTDELNATRVAGRVERYNAEEGYIILRSVIPPTPGTNAYIFRDGNRKAHAVFSEANQYPYSAAYVIQGSPKVGDLVVY